VGYTYDALNRLRTVTDNRSALYLNTTTYGYDEVGNLSSTVLPNGAAVTPSFDRMNRLTEVLVARQLAGSANVAAYSYLYGAVGNRVYASGSTGGPSVSTNYGYDSVYRMTQESINNAGSAQGGGTLSYGLDPVGNRSSLNSTVAGINSQTLGYDVNDRLTGNSFDANGNTLGANGKTFGYDSQDRMTKFNGGAVTMVYDGDGNRVSKTAGVVTTVYLVDEVAGGAAQKTYVYGLYQRTNLPNGRVDPRKTLTAVSYPIRTS
jgi:hypothetical protein